MIRKVTNVFAAAALAFNVAVAADGLQVDVYDGPTECDDAEKVKSGQFLSMHYTGTIDESSPTGVKGSKFDSSRDRGQTFDFQIGVGQVIKGWDQGIVGLCKGAKANLIIPSEFGYGDSGAGGDIPGGATLKFDVEVVDISDDAPEGAGGPDFGEDLFSVIDTDGSGDLTEAEVLAWFKTQGMDELPPELMEHEDQDKDGVISWEEFSGPKGSSPPGSDEL